ncbi:Sec-independent protein translocase protein TatB [Alphaproteobacteria bacterium]|nr:Sec-independent protein translocase protein TatB [Alphaproteobacteria bacterium]
MLDLGWSEIMVIGAIAIIVVGPNEMPKVIRTITNIFSKIKTFSNDFFDAMNDIANQENYNEIISELKKSNSELEKNIKDSNLSIYNAVEDEYNNNNKKTKNIKYKNKKK